MITKNKNIFSDMVLEQLPGSVFLKKIGKRASSYTWVNQFTVEMMGYKERSAILGISEDCFDSLKDCAAQLHQYDQSIIIGEEKTFLNIRRYAKSDMYGLYLKKSAFLDHSGSIVGVIAIGVPINSKFLMKTNLLSFLHSEKISDRLSVYEFTDSFPHLHLTKREGECLYYLLRGKTAKEIANLYKIHSKTVETHIATIKLKLGVNTRSQIYDYAYENNMLHIIPASLISDIFSC